MTVLRTVRPLRCRTVHCRSLKDHCVVGLSHSNNDKECAKRKKPAILSVAFGNKIAQTDRYALIKATYASALPTN